MAGDDVVITIRANNGDAVRAFRDTEGRLRDMRGRFVSESSIMARSMDRVSLSIRDVRRALIPLASAATPVAAALTPVAVKAAAAGAAVTAFGVAVAGQVSSLSDAAEAQEKYTDAVVKYGRGSKQAAEAQRMVSATLAGMPQATQRAAVGLQTLKDGFQDWSDSLASFTMAPVEKSFVVLGQAIPKLTPMVKGASSELDRLVTVAGGAVASPGFDAFADRVSTFANEALRDAVNEVIHFTRALSEGQASGPIKAFMEYAAQNGPQVRETLSTMGDAVSTLAQASAAAGPGMLTLVNAAAGLVAAMPPELVATLMQTALALKLVTLAGAGAAVVARGVQALGAQLTALGAASAAAGGGVAGLRAAFLALGTAAKASIVVGAIAALTVALSKLGDLGREAPPNVDRLTTSLGQLGRTGKTSGEAARLFGEDLDKLYDSVRSVSDPALIDNVQQGLVKVLSLSFADSTPVKEAKERLDGVDEALTNLVKGGKSEVAAAAFKRLSDEYVAGGGKLSEFTGQMDGYKSALADAKFEQELAAESMGVFGRAALDTQAKLDAQKQSADGLRQSILALNDANRSAYDAQIGFEQSLDDLTESFAEHGATLNLDTEAGRANAQAMSQAAAAHDEMLAAGVAAGDSLGSMTKKSSQLREEMLRLAEGTGMSNAEAKEYVNTLLGAPGEIKTMVRLEREEAIAGLRDVQAEIEQLPDGRTQVFTANGKALGNIGSVRSALNNLDGKTASTYVTNTVRTNYVTNYQTTGKYVPRGPTGAPLMRAGGGTVSGPGSGTSDDVPIMASNGEFVVREASVRKYGLGFLEALNSGRLPKFAGGGRVERQARRDAAGDLTVSYFGRKAGFRTTEFQHALGSPADIKALSSALNEWRSMIKKATHGGTERRLLSGLDKAGSALFKHERNLTGVNRALEKARDKLSDLKQAAGQLRDSVRSGIISAGSITGAAGGEGHVTVGGIMGSLTAARDKATSFAGALKSLKAKGLSKEAIAQIAQAGIEGGGLETAEALMGASKSEIRSMNKLQSQIASAASAAGKTAADTMYGAGLRGAEGLVKGLTRKQDKIEDAMMRIAKGMEKAIKKALGIRSPSRVMEQLGRYTAEGYALGVERNQRPRKAWESMLTTAPRPSATPHRAPAGGQQPFVLEIRSGGTRMDDVLVEVLRKAVAARGGNVQTVIGR